MIRGKKPDWTVQEVAKLLHVCANTVIKEFAGRPGVTNIGTKERRKLRISDAAVMRHRRQSEFPPHR
jgi:hypothetical protein